jgi:nucleolar GTP-binding protein
MTSEEIIEFAHNRSLRKNVKSSLRIPKLERTRIREISRTQEFSAQVKAKLREAVETFPSLERLHPFYLELAEILIGIDRLKQALGAVFNCIALIDKIVGSEIVAMKRATGPEQIKRFRSAAKGRVSSLLRETSKNLGTIIEAKKLMASLPGVNPNSPTIVCAGFPNVGKSTLVKAVSTAEPEIAYYPFTTREVIVGHMTVDNNVIQVVDTPGILDRPMSKRNQIERQAIAALKYLANVVIFMMDPSETCGWPFDEQYNLYTEVRRMFAVSPMIVVFNKVDITPLDRLEAARSRVPGARELVASEGVGVQELMREAVDSVDLTSMQESVRKYLSALPQRETSSSDS